MQLLSSYHPKFPALMLKFSGSVFLLLILDWLC